VEILVRRVSRRNGSFGALLDCRLPPAWVAVPAAALLASDWKARVLSGWFSPGRDPVGASDPARSAPMPAPTSKTRNPMMSCCGKQRSQFHAIKPAQPPTGPAFNSQRAAALARQFVICFEYIGTTGLTAIGGATGTRYRFDRPGARVIVDPRDRPSLAAVAKLQQV
jgi:hypothetical protein